MEPTQKSGRTGGDTIIEVLSNAKYILLAAAALLIASAMLLIAFFVVMNDAEPGSTIKIFGIEYQRAKQKTEVARGPASHPNTYILPAGEIVKRDQQIALPILDGSLALQPYLMYGSDSTGNSLKFLRGASIIGPNISKIRIASRSLDGRKASLIRPNKDDQQADFSLNTYVELEYRGKYFSIITEDVQNESMKITVKSIPEPTLELISVAKLPEYGGDG
jgi:hypothetical protein